MPRRKPLVQANGQMEQLPDGDFIEVGELNLEPRETIDAAATITVSSSFIRMRNTSGGTVNVDQINGGERGHVLIIMRRGGADDNTRFRKGPGNINGGPNRLMDSRDDILMLIKINNTQWNEVSWQG